MTEGAHILVVDDDEAHVGMAILDFLEGAGYRATTALSGHDALDRDAVAPADLLITDMTMPRMSGAELILRIRRRRPALPVILLSGYRPDAPAARLKDLRPGSFTLLAKPVRLEDLLKCMTTSLEPSPDTIMENGIQR